MKKLLIFIGLLALTGCQRGCASVERNFQVGPRNYHVQQYSGGKLIGDYRFNGILNNQEQSDGFYFYKQDTLVEVSGDITVTSW